MAMSHLTVQGTTGAHTIIQRHGQLPCGALVPSPGRFAHTDFECLHCAQASQLGLYLLCFKFCLLCFLALVQFSTYCARFYATLQSIMLLILIYSLNLYSSLVYEPLICYMPVV